MSISPHNMPSMANPYLVTREEIEAIARRREDLHRDHPTSRPLSDCYELIGLMGEWGFAKLTGLPLDLSLRPNGDGRSDFRTSVGDIDVKTADKAYNLLRECDKAHADILVLAHWKPGMETAIFLGWEWDEVMLQQPTRRFHDRGPMNHYKGNGSLRLMDILLYQLKPDRLYSDPMMPVIVTQLQLAI